MKILVTGTAGFIGFHIVEKLVKQKDIEIVGLDNINDYYDVQLKYARLQQSGIAVEQLRLHQPVQDSSYQSKQISLNQPIRSDKYPHYTFYKTDLSDITALRELFERHAFDVVIHLAAQAGVRYSIENPHAYIQSNIVGFANVLECCRRSDIRHLIYASSSSVYGVGDHIPFTEEADTSHPVSIYAATKKSDELLAYSYSHLFRLPTTGIRLFTVYGPWGRPDMAPMLFAEAISAGKPISVYNEGQMSRDFTYVDDIADGIVKLVTHAPDANSKHPFYQIFNIGHSEPVALMDFISTLEQAIGRQAQLELLPMQPGDVPITYADTSKLEQCTHYKPTTAIENGVAAFVAWFTKWKSETD